MLAEKALKELQNKASIRNIMESLKPLFVAGVVKLTVFA